MNLRVRQQRFILYFYLEKFAVRARGDRGEKIKLKEKKSTRERKEKGGAFAYRQKSEKWHMRQVDGTVVWRSGKAIINVRSVWQTGLYAGLYVSGWRTDQKGWTRIRALPFVWGCRPFVRLHNRYLAYTCATHKCAPVHLLSKVNSFEKAHPWVLITGTFAYPLRARANWSFHAFGVRPTRSFRSFSRAYASRPLFRRRKCKFNGTISGQQSHPEIGLLLSELDFVTSLESWNVNDETFVRGCVDWRVLQ